MQARAVALLTAIVLTAAACGTTGASESGGPSPTSIDPDPTSTSGPAPTVADEAALPADPADDGMTRVLFAGDSLMEEVHASVAAALGGAAETAFLLGPRLIRDETQELLWQNALDGFRPDLVVVLFGHWESLVLGAQTPADFDNIGVDAYADDLARPFADFINGNGPALLWLGAPPLREPQESAVYAVMNQVYGSVVAEAANARFVELGPAVTDEAGGYTDTLPNAFGTVERVRNTDGIHFCPGGAVRLANTVLGPMAEMTGVAPTPGWEDGPWRTQAPFDVPGECPAI